MKTKLTLEDIKSVVVSSEYIQNGTLMICILTLKNGFKVTGQSACLNPEVFNYEIGQKVAYDSALEGIWELEGYLLAQKRFEGELK